MFVLRRFEHERDYQRLIELRINIEAHDQTGADTSEASLRSQFDWPNHKRWVVENPEKEILIGHGWMFNQSDKRVITQVFVHPDWRRKGLGRRLMEAIVSHNSQEVDIQIVSGALASNTVAGLFLEAQGFEPVGNNRFFEALAEEEIDDPIWPEGFSVKSCHELGDLSMIVEGSNGCYADMWGHRENSEPMTMARVEDHIERWPNLYNPAGIFVVFDQANKLAGICFNRLEGDQQTKILDSPGVVPEYRHLGLQRPLVQHSMHWLQKQAAGNYHLHTFGDFDEAVEIYKRLGFILKPENHLIEYLLGSN